MDKLSQSARMIRFSFQAVDWSFANLESATQIPEKPSPCLMATVHILQSPSWALEPPKIRKIRSYPQLENSFEVSQQFPATIFVACGTVIPVLKPTAFETRRSYEMKTLWKFKITIGKAIGKYGKNHRKTLRKWRFTQPGVIKVWRWKLHQPNGSFVEWKLHGEEKGIKKALPRLMTQRIAL